MEIQLGEERLLLLGERLNSDEALQKATEKRTSAFGSGLGSLLQRPKVEDITFVGKQRRLTPFWHVAATSHYVYERRHDYTVPSASPEVTAVTVYGQRLEMDQRLDKQPAFRLPLLEHCQNDFRSESFTDGLTGSTVQDGPAVITGPKSEIGDVQTLEANDTIVIPPEQRASFVVRKTLADVMKPVQADKILEEKIMLQTTDLYYRPVWAFEFAWKDKRGVIEVDAINGHTQSGKPMMAQVKGLLNRDLLFDIGADTVGLFVPGGSIAVKLAKAAIDSKSK